MPTDLDRKAFRPIDYSISTPVDSGQTGQKRTSALQAGAVNAAHSGAAALTGGVAGEELGGLIGTGAGAVIAGGAEFATGGLATPAVPYIVGGGNLAGRLIGGYLGYQKAAQKEDELLAAHPDFARSVGMSQEDMQAYQEEHPTASFVGSLAGGFAGGKPSLKGLTSRITREMTPAEAGAIRLARGRMAGGTGLGAGMEVYNEVSNGEDLDPTKIAMSAGAGALMTGENRLGAKLRAPAARINEVATGGLSRGVDLLNRAPSIGAKLGIADRFERLSDTAVPGTAEYLQSLKAGMADARTARRKASDVPDVEFNDRAGDTGSGPAGLLEHMPSPARDGSTLYTDDLGRTGNSIYELDANRAATAERLGTAPGNLLTGPKYGETLALPAPPDFTVDSNGNVGRSRDLRGEAFALAPEGSQGNLFNAEPDRPGPGSAPTQAIPTADRGAAIRDAANQPTLFENTPTATVRTKYGLRQVLGYLRGDGKADQFTLKLANVLSGHLSGNDAFSATRLLDAAHEQLATANLKESTINQRLAVLDRAQGVLDAYNHDMTSAHADEAARSSRTGVKVGEPAPGPEGTIAQMKERNAGVDREAAQAQANQTIEDSHRQAIVKSVLDNPDVADHAARISEVLKKNNLDPTLRPSEVEQVRQLREQQTARADAEAAFKPETEDGTASLEAQIPEAKGDRGAARQARDQQAAAERRQSAPNETNKSRGKNPPPLELKAQTEADFAAKDAAEQRRAEKAARAESTPPAKDKAQGELFTTKGNPTKAADQRARAKAAEPPKEPTPPKGGKAREKAASAGEKRTERREKLGIKSKEKSNASEKGQVAEDGQRERQGTDEKRKAAEASRGNRAERGKANEPTEEALNDELPPEIVAQKAVSADIDAALDKGEIVPSQAASLKRMLAAGEHEKAAQALKDARAEVKRINDLAKAKTAIRKELDAGGHDNATKMKVITKLRADDVEGARKALDDVKAEREAEAKVGEEPEPEEPDFEEHPDVLEHDQKFDDAKDEIYDAENRADFRQLVKRFQKEGLIDSDDVTDINDTLSERGEEAFDTAKDQLEDALDRMKDDGRDEVIRDLEERHQRGEDISPLASTISNELPDPEAVKEQLEIGRKTGSTHAMLDALEKRGGMVGEAASLLRRIMPDVKVKVVSDNQLRLLMRKPGKVLPETLFDGVYNPADDTIYMSENLRDASVIVHEGPHALTAYHIANRTEIGRRFIELWKQYKDLAPKSDSYGLTTPDEFVSEIWRSEKFRQELRDLMPKEEPAPVAEAPAPAPEAPKSLWQKIKDVITSMFAKKLEEVKVAEPEAKAQQLTDHILEVMDLTRQAAKDRFVKGDAEVTPQAIERNVKEQPEAIRAGASSLAQAVGDNIGNKPNRNLLHMAMTPTVVKSAIKAGITSANKYWDVMKRRGAFAASIDQHFLKIANEAQKLAPERRAAGRGLHDLMFKMTSTDQWAFVPDYFRDPAAIEEAKKNINPALKEYFDKKLTRAEQDIVKSCFRELYNSFMNLHDIVLEQVDKRYNSVIAQTEKQIESMKGGDAEAIKGLQDNLSKLKKDRADFLGEYKNLAKIDPHKPYVPMTREGDWVILGMSKDYKAAEELARDGMLDWSKVRAMQEDHNHYFMWKAKTESEAARIERTLKSEGRYDETTSFADDPTRAQRGADRGTLEAYGKIYDTIQSMGGVDAPQLLSVVNQLRASALAMKSSARASELHRRLIAGGDFDMVRNTIQRGRANARLAGSIMYLDRINNAIKEMEDQSRAPNGERDFEGRKERADIFNQLMSRHVLTMRPPNQNDLARNIGNLTANYQIATSGSFFLQQLTQNFRHTLPKLMARFGEGNSVMKVAEMFKHMPKVFAGSSVHEPLNFSRFTPEQASVLQYIADMGNLDVGMNRELGEYTSGNARTTVGEKLATSELANTWNRLGNAVGAFGTMLERNNRVVGGLAAYELALKNASRLDARFLPNAEAYADYVHDFNLAYKLQGKVEGAWQDPKTGEHFSRQRMTEDQFKAAHYANWLVTETHGDFSDEAAPTFMRGPWQKLIFKYKKFPLMVGGNYGPAIHDAFMNTNLDPVEQRIAQKTVAYMLGSAAVFGGALGLPAIQQVGDLYDYLKEKMTGDPTDFETDARKALGDSPWTDVILHGAPAAANLNLTNSIGEGDMFSLAPYTKAPTDKRSANDYVAALTGPFFGGLVPQWADGIDKISRGQTMQGFEALLPKGFGSAIRAYREATEGSTDKHGLVITPADEIDGWRTAATALSLRTMDQSKEQHASSVKYNMSQNFDSQSGQLRDEFYQVWKARDTAGMARIRDQWRELQDRREANGFKRQPLSNLLKSARRNRKLEQNNIGGIRYDRSSRGAAEGLAETYGLDDGSDTEE